MHLPDHAGSHGVTCTSAPGEGARHGNQMSPVTHQSSSEGEGALYYISDNGLVKLSRADIAPFEHRSLSSYILLPVALARGFLQSATILQCTSAVLRACLSYALSRLSAFLEGAMGCFQALLCCCSLRPWQSRSMKAWTGSRQNGRNGSRSEQSAQSSDKKRAVCCLPCVCIDWEHFLSFREKGSTNIVGRGETSMKDLEKPPGCCKICTRRPAEQRKIVQQGHLYLMAAVAYMQGQQQVQGATRPAPASMSLLPKTPMSRKAQVCSSH